MLVAYSAALAAIALGTAIGLLSGSADRTANPFRTFAMVTAVAVVLGQLLPDALGALGIVALAVFAAGYAAPRVAERAAARFWRSSCEHPDAVCSDLGLEIGYVGLLLHQVGDGVGLGVFASPRHAGHAHYDVILAIAAHTIPVIALVVLAFRTHAGTARALLRVLGVVVATGVGLALTGLLPPAKMAAWEPWITAAVGGLLLHIVSHGWGGGARPTAQSRIMDLVAVAAGVGIVALGGHSHSAERGIPDLRHAMGDALVDLGLETAPMLLLGLGVAALLQTQGSRIPFAWLHAGGRFSQAIRGAVIGAPLPVCACGILPVAHSLRARGAATAVVVAFLISTPELGIETFALTVRFFGWELAWVRLAGALVVAVAAAWVVARVARHEHQHGPAGSGCCGSAPFAAEEATKVPLGRQVVSHLDELVYHVGAWTLIGLLAAAYVQAALDEGSLRALAASNADVFLLSLLAVPSYVCASSATPLGAVLLAKGVSPGAVLAALWLGPATNLATVAWLRKAYGTRAATYGMVGLLATTWLLAFAANALFPPGAAAAAVTLHEHEHGWVAYGSAVVLVALFVRAVWRSGLRSWLGSLGEGLASGTEPHSHEGHAHS